MALVFYKYFWDMYSTGQKFGHKWENVSKHLTGTVYSTFGLFLTQFVTHGLTVSSVHFTPQLV